VNYIKMPYLSVRHFSYFHPVLIMYCILQGWILLLMQSKSLIEALFGVGDSLNNNRKIKNIFDERRN
jgi:hypothetical protein